MRKSWAHKAGPLVISREMSVCRLDVSLQFREEACFWKRGQHQEHGSCCAGTKEAPGRGHGGLSPGRLRRENDEASRKLRRGQEEPRAGKGDHAGSGGSQSPGRGQ